MAKLFGGKKAKECRDIVCDADRRVEVLGEILNEEFKQRINVFGEMYNNEEDKRRRDLGLRSRHSQTKAVSNNNAYFRLSYLSIFVLLDQNMA